MSEERRQLHARPGLMWTLIAVMAGGGGYVVRDRDTAVHDSNISVDEAQRMSTKRDQIGALYDELRKESDACLQRQIDHLENKP